MKVLKSVKAKLLKGAQNNLSLAIYSIIIAILLWFVISMTFYPSVPKTIENVALSLDISGTPAAESGLSVIDCDVETVKVKLKGSRTQVGNMNSDSLTAYIDASNVTSTGKKTLSIKVKGSSNINYEIDSITPATATVFIDKYETREFKIKPKIPNINLADDKIIDYDEMTCEPDVINITGPSAKLDQISTENGCFAVSDNSETLNASYTLQNDKIELYGEDGSTINQDNITFDKSTFLMKIPVLTQKTASLSVALSNAPDNFDTEWLMSRLSLSPDSITIASGSAQAELPDKIDIGSIKLSEIGPGFSTSFDVNSTISKSKYGLKNQSGISTVDVKFDDTDLDTKDLYISNIGIRNKPSSNYDYSVSTSSIRITVVGPKDTLAELTANDFEAVADLLENETAKSSDSNSMVFSADVTVNCSDHNRVWAITKSKVQILKTPKEATSENTNNQ